MKAECSTMEVKNMKSTEKNVLKNTLQVRI